MCITHANVNTCHTDAHMTDVDMTDVHMTDCTHNRHMCKREHMPCSQRCTHMPHARAGAHMWHRLDCTCTHLILRHALFYTSTQFPGLKQTPAPGPFFQPERAGQQRNPGHRQIPAHSGVTLPIRVEVAVPSGCLVCGSTRSRTNPAVSPPSGP